MSKKKSRGKYAPPDWVPKQDEHLWALIALLNRHPELVSEHPNSREALRKVSAAAVKDRDPIAYSVNLQLWLLGNHCPVAPGVFVHGIFKPRKGARPKIETLRAVVEYLRNPNRTAGEIAKRLYPEKYAQKKNQKQLADKVRQQINRGLKLLGMNRADWKTKAC